ncbi:MAG: hypothetical protein LBJ08_01855, partial [Bifidobacteriaceae bacterium]|nr:hypothetical protein [Bifidobacteriaceae bacterium]
MRRVCAALAIVALPATAAVGFSTTASADPPATVTLTSAEYQDKLFAMWQAESIANWTGLRTELKRSAPPFYTEANNWYPATSTSGMNNYNASGGLVERNGTGPLNYAINVTFPWGSDDDTDIEYSYLWEIAENTQNIKLSADEIAHMWTTAIRRYIWYSDSQAEFLMEHGARPPAISHSFANLWRHWIDVNLVVEFFGTFAPGRPDVALDIAELPIRTVAGSYAVHAGQFEVIMYSLATVVDQIMPGESDRDKVKWMLEETLKYLPPESTMTEAIEWTMNRYYNY